MGKRWGCTLQGRSKRRRCEGGACTPSSCLGSAGQRRCFDRRGRAPARVPNALAARHMGAAAHRHPAAHVLAKPQSSAAQGKSQLLRPGARQTAPRGRVP